MLDQQLPPLPSQPQRSQPLQEKKELFQREEVRTMKKDTAKLQEEEAFKERERLSHLKTEDEMKKEVERIEKLKKEEEEKMFTKTETWEKVRSEIKAGEADKAAQQAKADEKAMAEEAARTKPPKPTYRLPFSLPRKPTFVDKFFSRAVVLGIMIALWGIILTFWYWYFIARPKGEQTTAPVTPPTETSTLPIEPPPTETSTLPIEPPPTETSTLPIEPPLLSPAIFRVNAENTIEFSSVGELPNLLTQAVQQYGGEDQFTRLALKNVERNVYLTTQEFFQAFQIQTPEGLGAQLSPDMTLFFYTSIIANRLGFMARITYPALDVKSWEPTLEQDTQYLFALLGKKEPSKDAAFRQTKYKNVTFRYISYPSINFGLVWSSVNLKSAETEEVQPYLILTSSGESMMRVIDRLADQIVP